MMSYWDFSDVFEEQGVVKTPFYGGYGMIAERGIPKAAFRAFELLHRLGDQRLASHLKTRWSRNGLMASMSSRYGIMWTPKNRGHPKLFNSNSRGSRQKISVGDSLLPAPPRLSKPGPRWEVRRIFRASRWKNFGALLNWLRQSSFRWRSQSSWRLTR